MKLIPFLLLLLLSPIRDDRDPALEAFRRAFRPARSPSQVQERREEALKALSDPEGPAAARALAEAYVRLEKEVAPIEALRRDYLDGKRKGLEFKQRVTLDPLRDLQQGIRERLGKIRDPEAVGLLVKQALRDDKLPFSLRVAFAERAGEAAGESVVRDIEAPLGRARDTESQVIALIAARRLGRDAAPLGKRILKRLDHEDPAVRELAALALSVLCLPEAIVPLIDRMEKEEGSTARGMADALQILTRQRFGTSAHAWRRWLEGEGKSYLKGDAKLGGGKPAERESKAPRYHEIPMSGRHIVYIIDRSNSMRSTMTKPSKRAEKVEDMRMHRAKTELCKALKRLPPDKAFNVIGFAMRGLRFAPDLVPATPKTIRAAQAWVRDLDFEFGTQLYDALEAAFYLAGRGTEDRYYDSGVDTVFVLTDGRPYIGNKPDSFKRIHSAVVRWNPLRRVTIHTIGLGDNVPKKHLKRLAAEHGGRFVHEESLKNHGK